MSARLTDEAFLAATDTLGDDERDVKAWQQAERALRAEVRCQLGLPTLDYGKTLDVAAIARAHGFDPCFDLKASDDDDVAAHHEDDKLRVLLTAKELDKRLKTVAERYGSHKRETGLYTLFMVLGFVQWFEDDNSDVALHAPLLLRDVELVRKVVAGRYLSTLNPGEDGLQVNVALAEKMRQHWGLELPQLRPEETPESYFVRVEAVLAEGKKMLFVAEKQAALRVVADRLRASGFGSLLLELHGDNAHRADVYDGLRERLKTRVALDPEVLASQRLQLDQQRSLLRRYLSLIDQPLGALGRTAYWLAWREIRLRETFDRPVVDAAAARWEPADAAVADRAMVADRRDRLDTFGAALAAVNASGRAGERTRWVEARLLDPFDQRRQLHAAAGAAAAAASVARAGADLRALTGFAMPEPGRAIDAADARLASPAPFEPVAEAIARAALRHPDTARALLRQQALWRQLCGKLAADIAVPAAVNSAAIDELARAIDSVHPVPLSVAVATERLAATTGAATTTQASAGERRLLADRLGLDPSLTVAATRVALGVVDELGREPATVVALYRRDLLDPLAEAAFHGERLRAAALREERQALASKVTEEAAETEPAEMTRIADVLAESGPFARLFGGAFRAARLFAGRLVRDPADRLATAELLRRFARHRDHAAAFQRDSAAAGWFPPVLWKGADSDWNAMERAGAMLSVARRQLADAGADAALGRWLALSADERVRVTAAIARVSPMLEQAGSAGLDAEPVADVGVMLTSRQRALEALTGRSPPPVPCPKGRSFVKARTSPTIWRFWRQRPTSSRCWPRRRGSSGSARSALRWSRSPGHWPMPTCCARSRGRCQSSRR